jgi:hypothetical protein
MSRLIKYRLLIILISIVNQVKGDCLYPEWKKTCQTFCMKNQLYEIQLNQCYSLNPNQLTCKCSGKDLTEKIKNIIQNNNSISSSSISTSIILSTMDGNTACLPSHPCTIGKISCYDINAYCSCHNGSWIKILCPNGNICKTQNTKTSCQTTSSLDEQISLFSLSSISPSIQIKEYFHFFVFCLLIIIKFNL